ncbi:MAG: hypothetical protein J7498_10330 [Sphingobium sp.]|nr:hypothetical protein [Sphingobium sp.]
MSNVPDARLKKLWAFVRGDVEQAEFEAWLYQDAELEDLLGTDLRWQLVSCDFKDRDATWQVQQALRDHLARASACECLALRDRCAVPMGGRELEDGQYYHEKVFSTLNEVISFGPEKWWLYISKCGQCETAWVVAQDDRIYDEFFMVRIGPAELTGALAGAWPDDFQSYEQVMAAGVKFSYPPRFLDPLAGSLQWAVEDLRRERPDISIDEMAALLGLTPEHIGLLLREVSRKSRGGFLAKLFGRRSGRV